jgi:diacylglycerol kinase (ATP)
MPSRKLKSAVSRFEAVPIAGTAADLKSTGGAGRIWRAFGYSWRGVAAAWRFEAAFRQEVGLGVVLILIAILWAPDRWQGLLLVASVLQVWLVELINSAIETVADAVSPDLHPLLGRAKDMGSAAVMVSLCLTAAAWLVVFWP